VADNRLQGLIFAALLALQAFESRQGCFVLGTSDFENEFGFKPKWFRRQRNPVFV